MDARQHDRTPRPRCLGRRAGFGRDRLAEVPSQAHRTGFVVHARHCVGRSAHAALTTSAANVRRTTASRFASIESTARSDATVGPSNAAGSGRAPRANDVRTRFLRSGYARLRLPAGHGGRRGVAATTSAMSRANRRLDAEGGRAGLERFFKNLPLPTATCTWPDPHSTASEGNWTGNSGIRCLRRRSCPRRPTPLPPQPSRPWRPRATSRRRTRQNAHSAHGAPDFG